MSWIRIAIINLLVLFLLLLLAEIALRLAWTVKSCISPRCDFSRITTLTIRGVDKKVSENSIRNIRFDADLGYVYREGTDLLVDDGSGWKSIEVTITKEGFRLNNAAIQPNKSDVLVVGDSFAFGTQVSNHETWPACLERKLARGVDNGGIGGYGAAQALKRAEMKLVNKEYSTLVWSILLGHDFARDRLSYREGFPKPAVIRKDGGSIGFSAVSDPKKPGTIFSPLKQDGLFPFLYKRFILLAFTMDMVRPEIAISEYRLSEAHPDAADKEAIIIWALERFSQLKINRKIILLQYSANYSTSFETQEERELIKTIARRLSLQVVDTSDVLTKYEATKLWMGHHTPFANKVVCEYLFERAFR